jgi:hypothetical protein
MNLIKSNNSQNKVEEVTSVKITGFSSLSLAEKKQHIVTTSQAVISPTVRQLEVQKQYLEAKISNFEIKYQMSSDKMKELLYSGKINETADICSWSILLKIRGDFESQHPTSWKSSF